MALQRGVMLAPGLFSPSFQHHGKIGIYSEAAAMITVLVLLGQVLELRARSRSGHTGTDHHRPLGRHCRSAGSMPISVFSEFSPRWWKLSQSMLRQIHSKLLYVPSIMSHSQFLL